MIKIEENDHDDDNDDDYVESDAVPGLITREKRSPRRRSKRRQSHNYHMMMRTF